MLCGINQTLRNFNTITHELEKINEQIGTFGPSFENPKQRKGASNSSRITQKRSSKDLSFKRGPLTNIQNIQPILSTLESIDVSIGMPQTTKHKTPKNMSQQPKLKKKSTTKLG